MQAPIHNNFIKTVNLSKAAAQCSPAPHGHTRRHRSAAAAKVSLHIILCAHAGFDRRRAFYYNRKEFAARRIFADNSRRRRRKDLISMEKKIGIVIADEMEFLPFLRLVVEHAGQESTSRGRRAAAFTLQKGGRTLSVKGVECGIGKAAAAAATAFLIAVTAIGRPLGKDAIEADKTLLKLAQSLDGMHTGAFGTGDLFLADPVKKDLYQSLFSITAFDMETAAIAQVCARCGVPFCSLRQISDDADDCSADDYTEMNDRAEDDLCRCLIALCDKILDEDALW